MNADSGHIAAPKQATGSDLSKGKADGAGSASTAPLSQQEALIILPSCSKNPLVVAATRLLNLIAHLRTVSSVADLAMLRRSLVDEIHFFEKQALAANVSRDEIIAARYCLCTALDEAAGQTPWGSNGLWANHSLLVNFHNETWGGEKYYQLMARLAQHPERHHQLLEILYYCNMLGFEGRFRIVENGHSQLNILKRRIAALLNTTSGGCESRLSPHWQGEQTKPAPGSMAPWAVAALCVLIAFSAYAWLSLSLARKSDAVLHRLVALEPPELVHVEQAPATTAARAGLHRFLEPEIRAGLLDVRELADRSIITLQGDDLFESGSAQIRSDYLGLLKRIAQTLDNFEGEVLVTGHADNVPMHNARFPSSWHLSEARARTVATLITKQMTQHARVQAEGRGEAEPVAANNTAAGRARNRRVEITLLRTNATSLHVLKPTPNKGSSEKPESADARGAVGYSEEFKYTNQYTRGALS